MQQNPVVVIGASLSGLAVAACLQRAGISYTIIEKEAQVAAPWRRHYERLHLHTNKSISHLPFMKFSAAVPRYPSRQQVIDYAEKYQQAFNIQPLFNTRAIKINRENNSWLTETNKGSISSPYLVLATGPFEIPLAFNVPGLESFPGPCLHSHAYRSGKDFAGQRVLVVGFGNSACEIAIDLHEQGAIPIMSVRSPVNIVPRDIAGIPIVQVSLLMRFLPAKLADTINAPLLRLLLGDVRKYGLQRSPYGPLEQIEKESKAPVLDIGTLKLIRQGKIELRPAIDHVQGNTVFFTDGRKEPFDAIIAAIGYRSTATELIENGSEILKDARKSPGRQQFFGKDGLYCCGCWIAPTGQIRQLSLDAKRIAKDIQNKEKHR